MSIYEIKSPMYMYMLLNDESDIALVERRGNNI